MKWLSGRKAEAAAAVFLARQGLSVLEKNYRCRFGEVDIIAREGPALIFVEVRKRRQWTEAAGSIDRRKRRKIERTASHYLARHEAFDDCRFDVIVVDDDGRLQWLKNAFDAESRD